jgi:hypothetical protein
MYFVEFNRLAKIVLVSCARACFRTRTTNTKHEIARLASESFERPAKTVLTGVLNCHAAEKDKGEGISPGHYHYNNVSREN